MVTGARRRVVADLRRHEIALGRFDDELKRQRPVTRNVQHQLTDGLRPGAAPLEPKSRQVPPFEKKPHVEAIPAGRSSAYQGNTRSSDVRTHAKYRKSGWVAVEQRKGAPDCATRNRSPASYFWNARGPPPINSPAASWVSPSFVRMRLMSSGNGKPSVVALSRLRARSDTFMSSPV